MRYQLKSNESLYFLHIPKTAGTSFTAILDNFFDFDDIYSEQVWHKLLQDKNRSFLQCKLIRGHFGYGLYHILPRKPLYITMLRHPIERTISFYDHMCLEPIRNNWVSEDFLSGINSLSDIFNDGRKALVFSNNQVRHISIDLKIPKILENKNIEKFRLEEFHEFIHSDISEEKMLRLAMEQLSHFVYFGIVEKFEKSLSLLYYTFGWKPLRHVRKLMVAPRKTNKTAINEKTLEKITEYNKLDNQLYEYAINLFEQRYNDMIDYLKNHYYESSLENLDEENLMFELLDRHYKENFSNLEPRKKENIEFNFKQRLFGNGWYYREFTSDQKEHAFRWTGPENISTIDLPLATKSDYKIIFRVIGKASDTILDGLRLRVNNTPIQLTKSNSNDDNPIFKGVTPVIFEGVIPRSAVEIQNKFSHFVFHTDHTIENITYSYLYANELRKIGIALDSIRIQRLNR